MKILHYINDLGSGGAEKLLTFILPEMANRGHDVHLAVSNHKHSVREYISTLQNANIKLYSFNISAYNPFNIYYIRRLIRREHFDVVHTHIFATEYWLTFVPKTAGIVFIKTEHGTTNKRRTLPILKPLERFVYGRYDLIITITENVKHKLADWVSPRHLPLKTIQNGLDIRTIKSAPACPDRLNPDTYNLLMTGKFRNDGSKDQLTLIRSMLLLPESIQLFFAGEGETMAIAKKLAKELNLEHRVHFLGLRIDVYNLMNTADINVLSTNHEGMSGVALEAMASQRPFIGSNVTGVSDIVPSSLFLFAPNSPEAIAQKVKSIANDEAICNRLIVEGNEHAKKFDIQTMVNHYLESYLSLSGK